MMFPTGNATNNSKHVLTTMAIVIYPIYIAALFWIFKSSLFWMSGRTLFIVSVITVFLGMSLFGYTKMIINVSRNLNSSGYTINEEGVYLDGKKIEHADPKTFESLTVNLKENISKYDSPYTKDNGHVFHEGKIVEGADPTSAEVIDPDFKWWLTDKDSLFFKGDKLP